MGMGIALWRALLHTRGDALPHGRAPFARLRSATVGGSRHRFPRTKGTPIGGPWTHRHWTRGLIGSRLVLENALQ